ncbi:MAG: hypothetical protein K2X11_03145 [Acetobacteraceae bacterium]|nr:hypothetical protein [Acetobacteraceae bacterium]
MPRLALALLVPLIALAGCGMRMPSLPSFTPDPPLASAIPVPPAPIVPTDPVSAFAAAARPGQEGTVTLEGGIPERARLTRVYQAASGRECREVILGSGVAERARIACRQADGSFAAARPLLRGAAR